MMRGADGRLRVLVVAGREPWPLNGGGRLRLYNFLRHLATTARVTLVLPRRAAHGGELPRDVEIVDASSESTQADQTRPPSWVVRLARRHYGWHAGLWNWLSRHARTPGFDVALLSGAVMGQYIDAIGVPAVWDPVDELVLYTLRGAAWNGARSWAASLRGAVLYAALEHYVGARAARVVFASSVDASYARRWIKGERVAVISNGVDFDYFRPAHEPPEPGTLVFVGSLGFPPNVEAAVRFSTRTWPEVRARAGARRLLIVGREPAAAVRDLAAVPGVEVHADVPDVRPFVARAVAVIVPTRLGGGVKNKVLEACALRRPVVASPRALGGLSARHGVDVLCAANEAQWVGHLARLLSDPTHAARVAENGLRWVRAAHAWDLMAGRLRAALHAASGVPASTAAVFSCSRSATGLPEVMRDAGNAPDALAQEELPVEALVR